MRTDKTIYNDPNLRALLYAVVLNDVEATKTLLATLEYKSLLEDIGLLSKPFPLHYISLCNEVIYRDADEWRVKDWAITQRDKSCAMVEFWKEFYGVNEFEKIDYRTYYDDFYCVDPDDTDEDILWAPKSKFIEVGNREIDVDLYCAVCRFDFERTLHLLEMGANPNVNLYDKPESELEEWEKFDGWHALDRIGTEESYLATETFWILRDAETDMIKRSWIDGGTISKILGIAAHSEMYELLEKYVNK